MYLYVPEFTSFPKYLVQIQYTSQFLPKARTFSLNVWLIIPTPQMTWNSKAHYSVMLNPWAWKLYLAHLHFMWTTQVKLYFNCTRNVGKFTPESRNLLEVQTYGQDQTSQPMADQQKDSYILRARTSSNWKRAQIYDSSGQRFRKTILRQVFKN